MVPHLTLLLAWTLLATGCASHRLPPRDRVFRMQQDSMAFANELAWEYHPDPETGEFRHAKREPPPTYSHHCFVVAKAVRQFFEHARFEPGLPRTDEDDYRRRVRRVTGLDPARLVPEEDKIIIPGYANLYEFSRDWEGLLKESCGGAWRSYTQRGHWRMIFPISRRHQAKTAEALQHAIDRGHPPVVHLFQFPALTINHAAILFGHRENDREIVFETYDPNRPDRPTALIFDKAKRTFRFPRNRYFVGGDVDVYEVYKSWLY